MHTLGFTPGHTTIFELALLINPILCMWLGFRFIFVCLFVHSFIFFRPNMPEVIPAVEVTSKHW